MNGAGPLWVVGWLAAAIIIPALAVTALTRMLDRRDARREAALREARRDVAAAWLGSPAGEAWYRDTTYARERP